MTRQSETSSERVWRLPAGVRFDRRTWGDETVLFNCASGQTHLLDALSARVLDAFTQQPWSVTGLSAVLAEEFAVDEQELGVRLHTVIEEFVRLGLLDVDAA